jgi:hypothetical protein
VAVLVSEGIAIPPTGPADREGMSETNNSPRARQHGPDGQGKLSRDELAEMQRDLFAARVAVNRAGTNLNQAVAAFNATGEPPVWLEHVVARVMKAVEELDRVESHVHRRLR